MGRNSVALLLSMPLVLLTWALLSFVLSVLLFVYRALPASIPTTSASTQPGDTTALGVMVTQGIIGALILVLAIGGLLVLLMQRYLWGHKPPDPVSEPPANGTMEIVGPIQIVQMPVTVYPAERAM